MKLMCHPSQEMNRSILRIGWTVVDGALKCSQLASALRLLCVIVLHLKDTMARVTSLQIEFANGRRISLPSAELDMLKTPSGGQKQTNGMSKTIRFTSQQPGIRLPFLTKSTLT